ncbi:DUF2798 domain-containing protein [Clostridium estertheticum]|uniref:DUF2798 domain-containing protein n=1 Tax=Clostridium estertheticum TaxID=238834 RepID=UPI00209A9E33|nr:DUF2798 domain-containing protein [Clostridium estertheticum]
MFRAFFTVIGMSMIMTNVGAGIGTGFSMELIRNFPIAWPRNFCIVIFLELLIVQAIARKMMRIIHKNQDNRQANEDVNDNRSTIIFLTKKGKELEPRFKEISQELYNIEYKCISENEKEVFQRVLEKIYNNF